MGIEDWVIGKVGRRLDRVRITVDPDRSIRIVYMGREKSITGFDKRYPDLSTPLKLSTLRFEAGLIQRYADQADSFALQRFSPEVLTDYYHGVYHGVSTHRKGNR